MNVLKREKQLAVVSALVEGNSIRSIERMTGVHRDTIMRLLIRVGEGCLRLLDDTMRNLPCRNVEVDEIWTFCLKKERRLTFEERFNQALGDQYVFVALDADNKLIPHFDVGKRTMVTAYRFIEDLQGRLRGRIQLTTDGFGPYIEAVERAWRGEVDYAQLIKTFAGRTLALAAMPRRECRERYQMSSTATPTLSECAHPMSSGTTSRSGCRYADSRG